MRANSVERHEADRFVFNAGWDVYDARTGETKLTVRWERTARMLTAPTWHGPRWMHRAYATFGLHDYTTAGVVRVAMGDIWTNDFGEQPTMPAKEAEIAEAAAVCRECGRPIDGSPAGWHCVKRY